jgi:hypothetical protein
MTHRCHSKLNSKEMTLFCGRSVHEGSGARFESAAYLCHATRQRSFIDNPLAMRECARETSWLSGKGRSAYWCSERRSSSSRRVRVGRTVAHLSSASHIPSRLDFHGGTGLVTPYFSAILPHTCPRSTSCSSDFIRIVVTSGILTMSVHFPGDYP